MCRLPYPVPTRSNLMAGLAGMDGLAAFDYYDVVDDDVFEDQSSDEFDYGSSLAQVRAPEIKPESLVDSKPVFPAPQLGFPTDDVPMVVQPTDLDLLALFTDSGATGNASSNTNVMQTGSPNNSCSSGISGSDMKTASATIVSSATVPPPRPTSASETKPSAAGMDPLQQLLALQQQQQVAKDMGMASFTNLSGFPGALLAAQLQQSHLLQQYALGGLRNKNGKTALEVEMQQERIKKRRRESAQRSRARKNSFMKTLEIENHHLKLENQRLKDALAKRDGNNGACSTTSTQPPASVTVLTDSVTQNVAPTAVGNFMCPA